MTPDQYRSCLAALRLSQQGAARLFKVNGTTSQRWARGKQDVPGAVAIALRLMVKHGVNAEEAAELAGER